ncbi:MAG: hypothetical protein ACSW75_01940, partial [Lachnospiraceae bacterium]
SKPTVRTPSSTPDGTSFTEDSVDSVDSTEDVTLETVLSTEDVALEAVLSTEDVLLAAEVVALVAADEVVLDVVDVVLDEAVPPQAARPRAIIEERTTAKIFFFMVSS